MPLVILWLSVLVFAFFGVVFFVHPAEWARSVDLGVASATARTEIRAMYGGFEIGIAVFLAWCALDPQRVRLGLIAAGCMFAGVACGRGFSLLTDSGARPIMYTIVSTEVIATVLAFVALRFVRD